MPTNPNRRSVLRALATGAVGAATSATWVESLTALARLQAQTPSAQAAMAAQDWKPRVLTARQNDLVVALTELIIPETDTPGARAVGVNRFVDTVLQGAPPAERERFLAGLTWLDQRSKSLFKADFLTAAAGDQTRLLTRLSAEGNPDKEEAAGRDFFQAIKSMTVNGYYTTQVGLRQELGDSGQLFLPKFEGCTHPEHQG
jgi:Gluconate 2-dehydrogenase subunit 3